MNTDDLMDARLRAAGERWRTATPPQSGRLVGAPAPVTLPDLVDRPRRRAGWSVLASAAAVVALAAGLTAALVTRSNHARPDIAGLIYAKPVASKTTDRAALIGTWRLISVANSKNAPTVTFANDIISIQEPCHVVGRNVVVGDGTLEIGVLDGPASINCVSKREIGGTLTGRSTWLIKDGKLSITKGGTTLTFTKVGGR